MQKHGRNEKELKREIANTKRRLGCIDHTTLTSRASLMHKGLGVYQIRGIPEEKLASERRVYEIMSRMRNPRLIKGVEDSPSFKERVLVRKRGGRFLLAYLVGENKAQVHPLHPRFRFLEEDDYSHVEARRMHRLMHRSTPSRLTWDSLRQVSINPASGCWETSKSRVPDLAKRVWNHFMGRSVAQGRLLRHVCDNRKCVSPFHLIEGTHSENGLDNEFPAWMRLFLKRNVGVGVDPMKLAKTKFSPTIEHFILPETRDGVETGRSAYVWDRRKKQWGVQELRWLSGWVCHLSAEGQYYFLLVYSDGKGEAPRGSFVWLHVPREVFREAEPFLAEWMEWTEENTRLEWVPGDCAPEGGEGEEAWPVTPAGHLRFAAYRSSWSNRKRPTWQVSGDRAPGEVAEAVMSFFGLDEPEDIDHWDGDDSVYPNAATGRFGLAHDF